MKHLNYSLIIFLFISCSHHIVETERSPASLKWTNCIDGISKFFNRDKVDFNYLNQIILKINETEYSKIEALSNRSDMFVYEYLERYPEFKEIIKAMPIDDKGKKQFLKFLSEKIENFHSTMTYEVLRVFERRNLGNGKTASDYLENMRLAHAKLSKIDLDKINIELEKIIEIQKLSKFYQGNFSAEIQHDSGFIYIEGERYPYKEEGESIVITIPKEKAKSPAWNPLTREQREKIIANNVPAPDVYETVMGLDGKFYLLDGNHRFHLKETKAKIKVKISSFKTAPLNIFIDLVGESHIDYKSLKLVYSGEKTILDVVPDKLRSKIIFSELVVQK